MQHVKGRFAPSPTGRMHAGNVFAALMSWLIVKSQGGSIVLRIEDLDVQRSKQEWITQVQRDFELLGLTWDEGPYFQHDRTEAYRDAFNQIAETGQVYPCFCTRADLHTASAPHRGEKQVYAGTCRNLSPREIEHRSTLRSPAYRLCVPNRAIELHDLIQGTYIQNLEDECGDFIIRRADGLFAYQLAVVVDDAEQGINCIVRGIDLLSSTPQQLYLQDLLNAPHPTYAHVPLFISHDNRRLAKRDHDAALDALIQTYGDARGVMGHIAYKAGLLPTDEPTSPEELLTQFSLDKLQTTFTDRIQIRWK